MILAGVLVAAFTAPTLAAPGSWHVLKVQSGQAAQHDCIVVPRAAYSGEKQIGTYASKAQAQNIAANGRICENRNFERSD